MTEDEVIGLLQVAAMYDHRNIGQTEITAWSDAAGRGRWTADAAQDAIRRHYATSTAYLMPGHVTELLRAERRQPEAYGDRRALPRPPLSPETIQRGVDGVFAALAAKRALKDGTDPADAADIAEGEAGARREIRSVACPYCRAAAGRPCVVVGARKEREKTGYHPARVELAAGGGAAA